MVFVACIAYRWLSPTYRAEMKVFISRGRVDPALTSRSHANSTLEREEVTEEELNSEVELLHDQEILKTVTQAAGLFPESGFSVWKLLGESDEERLARAVRRLGPPTRPSSPPRKPAADHGNVRLLQSRAVRQGA